MPYNLQSPNGLAEDCDLSDLEGWFSRELPQITSEPERAVLSTVAGNLDSFVRWADEAILLWPSCNRVPEPEKKQKYFSYPDHIKDLARAQSIRLDTRANGPAVASFLIAGGERPQRFGSSNAWSIHHLYSGKFPYRRNQETTHAAKECYHFTQSAGLVAVHPVADSLADECPFFTWLLRAKTFVKFGYDPDRAFSTVVDGYGFVAGRTCRVISALAVESVRDYEERVEQYRNSEEGSANPTARAGLLTQPLSRIPVGCLR
jgi:hypothetical protein